MEEKLRQLFKNRANAYLNTIDESVEQGMDEDCFVKTVTEAFALYNVVGRSEQLKCMMKRTDGNCDCGIGSCIEGGW